MSAKTYKGTLADARKNYLSNTLHYLLAFSGDSDCEHKNFIKGSLCLNINSETLYTREKGSVGATCRLCKQELRYPDLGSEDTLVESKKLFQERAAFYILHKFTDNYDLFMDFLVGETEERPTIWAFIVQNIYIHKEVGLSDLAWMATRVLEDHLDAEYFLQAVRAVKSCKELAQYHEKTDELLHAFVEFFEEKRTVDSPYEDICTELEINW